MNENYFFSNLISTLRGLSDLPGLLQLKNSFRHIQAVANRTEFAQMQQLVDTLPLAALLKCQPRFVYKYLTSYAAASFSRAVRLATILHHYQFLAAVVRPDFFTIVAQQPILWQDSVGEEQFRIELSYPVLAWFEGELSLHFLANDTLVQMLTFVIVPGTTVGLAAPQVLLISQVQGTKNGELLKHTTKCLHELTPASLLVNVAYGLAAALGLDHAVGISTREQLGRGSKLHFDYNSFWQQFRGEWLATPFYQLDMNAPEKPIEEVKAKYRSRTLRKRQYKQLVRQLATANFLTHFTRTTTAVAPVLAPSTSASA